MCWLSMFASPAPVVTWSRAGGTLLGSRHITSSFQTQLTIENVTESDAGDYECRGSNDQGSARHRIHVSVGGESHSGCAFVCHRWVPSCSVIFYMLL